MLPQQAIYEDWPRGEIKKMSKPVQVCTACQFVTLIIYGQNYSQVGHKSYCAKKTGKQGKVIALCSFLHFLLRLNLKNSLLGKSPLYPSTSNATGSKGPETTWQAGESGTTFLIFEKSPFGHFLKMACRWSIPGTLWHQFHWRLLVHSERFSYHYFIENSEKAISALCIMRFLLAYVICNPPEKC